MKNVGKTQKPKTKRKTICKRNTNLKTVTKYPNVKASHKPGGKNQDNIRHNEGNDDIVNDEETGSNGEHVNHVTIHSKVKTTHKNIDDKDNTVNDNGVVKSNTNKGKKKSKVNKPKFLAPLRKPTETEERSMIGKAMEMLVVSCMKKHVYKFDNKIRLQSDGGPIGLGLTGEIADCLMVKWDKLFLQKCKDIGIEVLMYSRFKDDIFISTLNVEKGTTLIDDKLVLDTNKRIEDEGKEDDVITMEIVRQIADKVNPMLKFTLDVPSQHEDGKIAVLDLKVNINESMNNRIDYEFYEKPTKNPKILQADSAINAASKRTILTQECLRRIRNTKVELGNDIRNKHLNEFMVKMKNSGQKKLYRRQILQSSLHAFEKMLEEDKNGTKPLFRDGKWNKENRMKSKENKKNNWYKNQTKSEIIYKSILFVPPTHLGVVF